MGMEDICHAVMGDRMINSVIDDKKKWAETFNIGLNEKGKPLRARMSNAEFAHKVEA